MATQTTQQIIDYYANLLIIQYVNQPKAFSTMQLWASLPVMDQLPSAVQNAYNINTAVGVQLNIIGKYVGVSRNQYNFSGPVTLSDDDYRLLIKIQIVQNNSGSTLAAIQNLLNTFFAGIITVFDYQDMTMDYFFDSVIGVDNIAEVFIRGGFLPRPMAVRLRATIIAPTTNFFFGMRTYFSAGYKINPFNNYTNYQTNWPWLSYTDAIIG